MKRSDIIFNSYSQTNGIYSTVTSIVDTNKYSGFLFTFKYANKYLDSAFIPISFLVNLYDSTHCYVLNDGVGESRAEIYYNHTSKNFVITFNKPYFPVSIHGIY